MEDLQRHLEGAEEQGTPDSTTDQDPRYDEFGRDKELLAWQPLDITELTPEQLAACQELFRRGDISWFLHPGQQRIVDWLDERRRDPAVICCSRQLGKGLALNTPIATPSGFKAMGELRVGDEVFDKDGKVCRVQFVSDIHNINCFEVEFNTGERIVCDENHLWLTQSKRERGRAHDRKAHPRRRPHNGKYGDHSRGKYTTPTESVKGIREIAATVKIHGESNHAVPVAGALDLPPLDLPVDPYLLGYWLGDGHSAGARITVGAQDALAFSVAMTVCGEPISRQVSLETNGSYGIGKRERGSPHSLHVRLRELGLLDNKHIPPVYLRGALHQRWRLLQGLMDSDGSVHEICEFSNTNRRLIEDVHELVCSLGLRPAPITYRQTMCNGKLCNSYRFTFSAYDHHPVFALHRKQRRLRPPPRHGSIGNRYIVNVRRVPSVLTRCIQVDSPSHTYLVGRSFIPTHNSTMALAYCIAYCLSHPKSTVLYIAPHRSQLENYMLPRLNLIFQWLHTDDMPVRRSGGTLWTFANGSIFRLEGQSIGKGTRLRGDACHLCVMDECRDMLDLQVTIESHIMPMFVTTNGQLILISTPPESPLHAFTSKYIAEAVANGNFYTASYKENPLLKTSFLRNQVMTTYPGGEKNPTFRREYMADYTIADTDKRVVREWDEEANDAFFAEYEGPPTTVRMYTGMDYAFSDPCGIVVGYLDHEAGCLIIEEEYFARGKQTDDIALKIIELEAKLRENLRQRIAAKHRMLPKDVSLPDPIRVMDIDPSLMNELYTRYGLRFQPAQKQHSTLAMLNKLRVAILQGKLRVTENCRQLRFQLRAGVFNSKGTDYLRTKEGGHLDLVDALKYLVISARWNDVEIADRQGEKPNAFLGPFNRPPAPTTFKSGVINRPW